MPVVSRHALEKAFAKRAKLHHSCSVYRLFDHVGDGVPGLWIDRYGPAALLHEGLSEIQYPAALHELLQEVGVTTAYIRRHARRAQETAEDWAEIIFGDLSTPFVVEEGELRFEVDPLRQVNAGLFVDTRGIRRELLTISREKRLINLFAFTGSLGVAAACGGAREVVQVDLSKSALAWARRNRDLNSSAESTLMKFYPDDARDFLRREVRRMERGAEAADIIVLDPPSFGHSGGKPFRIETDFQDLIRLSMQVLAPGGVLYASCNTRGISISDVQQIVDGVMKRVSRSVTQVTPILPPEDFTSPAGDSHAVRGISVRVR